jgi:hypothetical protein
MHSFLLNFQPRLSRSCGCCFKSGNYRLDNVLVSLSIYYSVKTSNFLVFSGVFDEALDFLLAILDVAAATFQLKSQFRFYFFNQAFSFAAAPKPPPTNAPPTAPQPEPQPELCLLQQQPSLQPRSATITPSPPDLTSTPIVFKF